MGRSPQSCGCQHGRVQRLIGITPAVLVYYLQCMRCFSFIKTSRKMPRIGCVCRKLKLGHNGDAIRRGSRRNGCSQLVEPGARTARPYPASDAFAIHYSRRHRRLKSGAGAPRPVQRNGRDIPVGSTRLIFPQNSSAKASRGRWVCHGCPWLACGV